MPFDVTSDGLTGGPTSWSFEITPEFREVLTHRASADQVAEGVVLLGILTGDVRPCDESAADSEIWSNAPHSAPTATTPGQMVQSLKKLVLKRLGPLSEPRSDLVWTVIRQAELSTVSDASCIAPSVSTPPALFNHDGATVTITAASSRASDSQQTIEGSDGETPATAKPTPSDAADKQSTPDSTPDASPGSPSPDESDTTGSEESDTAGDKSESPTAPSDTNDAAQEAPPREDEQSSDDESPPAPADTDESSGENSSPAVNDGSSTAAGAQSGTSDDTKPAATNTTTDEPTETQSTSPAPATGTPNETSESASAGESSGELASKTDTETSSSILEQAAEAATGDAQDGDTTTDTASATEADDDLSDATSKYDTSSASPLRNRDTAETTEETSSGNGTASATTESNATDSSDQQSPTVSTTDDTTTCPFCGKTYPSKQVVARHANQCRRRPSGKTFDCNHCDKQFASPPARDLHQRECTDSTGEQSGLVCDTCGDILDPSRLTTHQRTCGKSKTPARSTPDGERRSGVMTEYDSAGGYGFLRITPESHNTAASERVFLHVSDCDGSPSVGDVVEFTLVEGDEGPKAENAIITEEAPASTAPEPRDTPFSSRRSRWGRDS